MGKYWTIFVNSIQTGFTYRAEILFRALRHIVLAAVFIFLWLTIFKTQTQIKGFDEHSIVTYYLLAEILDIIYTARPARYLTRQIKNGDLSFFLIKPFSHKLNVFAQVVGEQVAKSSLSVLIVVAVFLLFPNHIFVQTNPLYVFLFCLSIVLAWILYFHIFYFVGLISFWFSETSYIRMSINQLVIILAGRWVPLSFLPPFLFALTNVLPFQYLFSFIINTYLGKNSLDKIVLALGIESLWIVAFSILISFLWKKGAKRYEAYGA